MPIANANANAPRIRLFPAPSMENRPAPAPAPASGLAAHLAGVSSTANASLEPAPLSPHRAHASATGQSNFSPCIAPPRAMAHPSAGRVRHAEGQHTSPSAFSVDDADAPAPAKRPRLTENNRLLHVALKAQELGAPGIMYAGGLKDLAGRYGVPHHALRQLIGADGNLTAKGQDKIDREVLPNIDPEARASRSQPITGRFLQELSALGREGFQSGGVAALAEQHNVSADSLLKLIR